MTTLACIIGMRQNSHQTQYYVFDTTQMVFTSADIIHTNTNNLYLPNFLFLHANVKHPICYNGFGRDGGVLVESMPFDRRVVGSNPALAAT